MEQQNRDLIEYFIAQTNKKLDSIDQKVDNLLLFKWQIIGGSVVLSTVISFSMAVFLKFYF